MLKECWYENWLMAKGACGDDTLRRRAIREAITGDVIYAGKRRTSEPRIHVRDFVAALHIAAVPRQYGKH